jgi:hypothetical protein
MLLDHPASFIILLKSKASCIITIMKVYKIVVSDLTQAT